VYLSVLRVDTDALDRRHPGRTRDIDQVRILRSAVMKPEAETYLDDLHRRIEGLVKEKER
jgi:hypothetical protein